MNRKQNKITVMLGAVALAGVLFGMSGLAVGEEPYDEDTYGPKAPILFNKPAKGVVFSHKTHTMDAELACDSCHDDLFAMEIGSTEAKNDFTMKSLYAGQYCGACHDGSTAFASNTNCGSCHNAPTEQIVFVKPVKAVVFSHTAHASDAGLGCDSCHDELFKMSTGTAEAAEDYTMQSLYDGKYCGACHDGSTAFASNTRCNTCHIGVKGFDRLHGGAAAPDAHGGGGH